MRRKISDWFFGRILEQFCTPRKCPKLANKKNGLWCFAWSPSCIPYYFFSQKNTEIRILSWMISWKLTKMWRTKSFNFGDLVFIFVHFLEKCRHGSYFCHLQFICKFLLICIYKFPYFWHMYFICKFPSIIYFSIFWILTSTCFLEIPF